MRLIILLLALCIAVVAGGYREKLAQSPLVDKDALLFQQVQQSIHQMPVELTSNKHQKGTTTFLANNRVISEDWLHQYLKKNNLKSTNSSSFVWYDDNKNTATMSAMGIDWQHHFVNSYLVGIRPFAVENPWLPLYVIAKTKTYQLDSEQYNTSELWQNSAQAFMLPRGDCEDHAIALADWLISEEIDARVVVGEYKEGGHAWVVAYRNGQAYLLEATQKRVRKTWNHYPLATVAQHYYPKYMFNRRDFWVNTGPTTTKNYQGSHWVKRSTFKKSS